MGLWGTERLCGGFWLGPGAGMDPGEETWVAFVSSRWILGGIPRYSMPGQHSDLVQQTRTVWGYEGLNGCVGCRGWVLGLEWTQEKGPGWYFALPEGFLEIFTGTACQASIVLWYSRPEQHGVMGD